MAKLLSLVPYILALVVLSGAIVEFNKDSDKFKNSKLKTTALIVLFLGSVLTLVSLYQDNREKENARQEMRRLEGKADAANSAQVANTLLYIGSFQRLNTELSELKTQIKTDALQKKLTSVATELEATRRALLPGPKATLAFTFWPFYNPPPPQLAVLATQARFPTNDDGSYHIEFTVVNLTDVDALDGEFILTICDLCKFAKEPPGFTKLDGQSDNERNQVFQRILARTHIPDMTADIIMPKNQNFTMGITYRCHTCILSSEPSMGTVLVSGSILKQAPKARLPVQKLK